MQPLPTIEGFVTDQYPQHTVRLRVDLPPMIPGRYYVTAVILHHNSEVIDQAKECVGFEISQSPTAGRTFPHTSDHGFIVPHTEMEYLPQ